jgi:hypothetical protein
MGLDEGLVAACAAAKRLIQAVDNIWASAPPHGQERWQELFAAAADLLLSAKRAEEAAGDRPDVSAALRHLVNAGAALAPPPSVGTAGYPTDVYLGHFAEHYSDLRSAFHSRLLQLAALTWPAPAAPTSAVAAPEEAPLTGAGSADGADIEARRAQAAGGGQAPPYLPDQYVTLDKMAALVNRSKKTLERYKSRGELPSPDVEGGGGRADEWIWRRIRPWLQQKFKRQLPERYPSLR